ncbi:MAG TPA: ATP-dependent helicase [Vicinamibacterales bacterium]|jgi:DNA helicase-2/ATP-dependent DNA helicase PcrA|nr:ATP-dependent helicase [Vicinamibacterales bacterium]
MNADGPHWDDDLTGVAREIASTDDSPLRVLAGPGTGKTYSMKRRVMRLLQEEADPGRLLACTFTRTAARDIAREIAGLGVPGADGVWAGTLHSFCFSVLRRQAVLETTGRMARPLTSSEERFLIEDLRSFGGVREAGKKLEAFAAAWARLQTDDPGWPHNAADRAFQTALHDWLRFHGAMLVGEMVPVTLEYVRSNPLCDERYLFDHVIVDEYQDLNRAEQLLIDLLAEQGSLSIIGDEDQSIYSFKHAHPEGISTFADAHPGTHDETLSQCRRCPTDVVAMANSLILHNASASGRPLEPRPENREGDIHIVQWNSLEEEAAGIAAYVLQRIEQGGLTAGEVLILAPRRQLGYAVRNALREGGVVAHSFFNEQALDGNPKELDHCAAQHAYALLTLLADPDDRVALRCWCGFGLNSLGEPGWRRVRARCEATGASPRDVLEQLLIGEIKIAHTGPVVERYALLKEREEALSGVTGHTLADLLFLEGADWAESLRAIVTSSFPRNAGFGADDLLEEVRTGVTQLETPTDVDYVRVMSLHKSKGLTARLVVIMGCVEGVIPRIDFDEPPVAQQRSLEEQRRLFYVAVTRTTEILVISSVTRIPPQQALHMGVTLVRGAARTSRFVTELGPTQPAAQVGGEILEN